MDDLVTTITAQAVDGYIDQAACIKATKDMVSKFQHSTLVSRSTRKDLAKVLGAIKQVLAAQQKNTPPPEMELKLCSPLGIKRQEVSDVTSHVCSDATLCGIPCQLYSLPEQSTRVRKHTLLAAMGICARGDVIVRTCKGEDLVTLMDRLKEIKARKGH